MATETNAETTDTASRDHHRYALLIGASFSVSLFLVLWYATGLVLSLEGTAGAVRLWLLATISTAAFTAGVVDALRRLDVSEFADDEGDR